MGKGSRLRILDVKKILVADDDKAILEVIKIILEENGYSVIAVDSGAEVLDLIEKNIPDLVLLDVWMSGYDGRDIAKQIRTQEKTKGIPIVIISAHHNTAKMASDAGANDFIAKPFDITSLLSKVAKYTTV